MHTPTYQINLFGELRILREGEVRLHLRPNKSAVLLSCLALSPHRDHPREALMERLWPEVDPVAGRNRLKQTLSVLRGELEAAGIASQAILVVGRATLRLAPGVTTDVDAFERTRRTAVHAPHDQQAALHKHAITLAHAELLPAFYEDWLVLERERLLQETQDSLLTLVSVCEAQGQLQEALFYARRAAQIDPLGEEAHTTILRLHPMRERLVGTALPRLESVGGAVPLSSSFYLVRTADQAFVEAITQRDSIVLVKGPRQIGKTSLLARGLQRARELGARVVLTDLQRLTVPQLKSADTLFRYLAEAIAEQLEESGIAAPTWDVERGWNVNFERFLRREVLAKEESPLVWGIDEVDRLFSCTYGSEVFGLFRSWHNLRALHPTGPWSRLTLAMAYATEAHLFITDLNQSPFNVGTRLTLEDFTREQVAELNRRYGSPLKSALQRDRFFDLLGGSPYLVRRGLHEMVTQDRDLDTFEAVALREEGPFHDHLNRLILLLKGEERLQGIVLTTLRGESCHDVEGFYRLRSAGVLLGELNVPRLRCGLYTEYFTRGLV